MADNFTPCTSASLMGAEQPAWSEAQLEFGEAVASGEASYDALAFATQAAAVARDAAFLCASLEHMSTLAFFDRRFSAPMHTPNA